MGKKVQKDLFEKKQFQPKKSWKKIDRFCCFWTTIL